MKRTTKASARKRATSHKQTVPVIQAEAVIPETDYDRGVNDAARVLKLALQLKPGETTDTEPTADGSAVRRNLPEIVKACLEAADWDAETLATVKAVLESGPKKESAAAQPESPEWVQWTPNEPVYVLEMEVPGTQSACEQHEQFILLTREEYFALKIHLCVLRGHSVTDHLRVYRNCLRLERELEERDRTQAARPGA